MKAEMVILQHLMDRSTVLVVGVGAGGRRAGAGRNVYGHSARFLRTISVSVDHGVFLYPVRYFLVYLKPEVVEVPRPGILARNRVVQVAVTFGLTR